jgi:3-phosphoshikimate 1-carboxyvinyltransferase
MSRIVDPLSDFGVNIKSNNGLLPIEIKKTDKKKLGFDYNLKIASAQVKSALMLYAFNIKKDCTIRGKIHTRDHLERLFNFFKYPISIEKNKIQLSKGQLLETNWSIEIPGDISSASFLIAGAVLLKNSDLIIKKVGMNKYRMGFINKLIKMGANIKVASYLTPEGEQEGNLHVWYSKSLKGITINSEEVSSMIDEIPILCVVAAFAQTKTIIKGVNELKFKESDRIKSIIENFKSMGGLIEINNNNLVITPTNNLYSTNIKSYGDHRIFMSFYIANLVLGTFYSDTLSEKCYDKSFKNFINIVKEIVHENL